VILRPRAPVERLERGQQRQTDQERRDHLDELLEDHGSSNAAIRSSPGPYSTASATCEAMPQTVPARSSPRPLVDLPELIGREEDEEGREPDPQLRQARRGVEPPPSSARRAAQNHNAAE
jgi:hypothetical protein